MKQVLKVSGVALALVLMSSCSTTNTTDATTYVADVFPPYTAGYADPNDYFWNIGYVPGYNDYGVNYYGTHYYETTSPYYHINQSNVYYNRHFVRGYHRNIRGWR